MSASGEVKNWNDDRGFGFISPADGGDDLFVHRNSLVGCEALSMGDKVQYDSEYDDRKGKSRAVNVTGGTGTKGSGDGGGKGGGYGGGGYGGGKGGSQPCFQFQKGNCTYGDSCKYAHEGGGGYGGGGGGGGYGGGYGASSGGYGGSSGGYGGSSGGYGGDSSGRYNPY